MMCLLFAGSYLQVSADLDKCSILCLSSSQCLVSSVFSQ